MDTAPGVLFIARQVVDDANDPGAWRPAQTDIRAAIDDFYE
ncbi:hypothetical protein [Pseudomonas sp. M47T1]|nr:hypothetical protein [Pseudomonas sp. M47T1]